MACRYTDHPAFGRRDPDPATHGALSISANFSCAVCLRQLWRRPSLMLRPAQHDHNVCHCYGHSRGAARDGDGACQGHEEERYAPPAAAAAAAATRPI